MFKIPDTILAKLKCYLCDGYLNAEPVMVRNDHNQQQICSKCFKILPQEEKEQCVRQIAFEAIGNCLIFPCRYHEMGCDFTFTWNCENGHETLCKKRYFTIPDVVIMNSNSNNNNNNNSEKLNSESTQTEISLSSEPNNNNNNLLVYENIYATIDSTIYSSSWHCLNCNISVDKNGKNSCLYGHISCNNCKGDMCIACVKNLDGNSKIACKNAAKGCKELLSQSDVGTHRDNCEFNEIHCPIDSCDKKLMFEALKEHLKTEHNDISHKIILVSEFSKNLSQKDQSLIFVCHDGIFKCLYYYYITSVEIVVVYLGPCLKANEFSYEVSVATNQTVIRKKLICANWNNCMLARGVSFDKKELQINDEKPLKFHLDLKITQVNNNK